jgi:lantibiotic modifying enzyme
VLQQASCWLEAAPAPPGYHVPGLYVGEAGVGAALLRAGVALGDAQLIESAEARGRLVANLPYESPDLFNGTAGRLRFHVLLWDATNRSDHLRDATAAASALLEAAIEDPQGGVYWVAPEGFGRTTGKAFVGYAHGSAGIADALLDLYEITNDATLMDTIKRAAQWVLRSAVSSMSDRSGIDWPVYAGESEGQGMWCHGAAGVGRFLLHASIHNVVPNALELAQRAGRTVAYATRWAGPAQCHGLSGSIEYLLDLYRSSDDDAYLNQARQFGGVLDAFQDDHSSIDYLGGDAGIVACLLRLSEPDRRATLLSRESFQRCRGVLA